MKCRLIPHPTLRHAFLVLLDEEPFAQVGISIVGKHWKVPEEVESAARLRCIVDESVQTGAKRYALWRLSKCAMSTLKLRKILVEKGVPEEVCDEVIASNQRLGYLDDVAFAEQLTKRTKRSLCGLQAVKRAFYKQGIDPSLAVSSYQDSTTPEEEREAILAFANKRRNRPKTRAEHQKLIAALMRRGFSYDAICKSLN